MAAMGMKKGVLMLALGLAMAVTSSAVVYKVGDASGWTILGNVNYTDWTSKQNFRVGDTIEFTYPPGIHNVLEVNKADYHSCTNSTPIATHTSGDDKIVIKSPGHRFFICGVPGHCAAGQKLSIRVLKTRSSDAPSPAPAARSASAASPSPSGSTSTDPSGAGASASPPASSTDSTPDATTTTAPAPDANGAGVSAGHRAVVAAMALAAAASMAMLY
ncbi:Blue copper protein-like precursor [Zea mays]|uniref:Cupredoxin superfamily protein n=1 Tax=Zea mays TaxID=4577 RepID=A0A1D6GF63_MAIZE|nr:Blue copper protein-like precursor [Zea mays]AQK62212.1 Cupredoxin superfamily protein [Zea mays]|eukprot:NP_001310278.1 uncharacterized protein LOC107603301 precursor [Zea mays]